MGWRKYLNNQNWNIGFVLCDPEQLLNNKRLDKISWMKHSYKDRFFADPFILTKTSNEIVIFAEELEFSQSKGRLVELVVDTKTKKLLNRYVLLELDTHLSYPAIKKIGNRVFVYPENGASGKLSLYEYQKESHSLKFVCILLNEPLTDATLFEVENHQLMFATKAPNTQEDLFLYKSASIDGVYEQVGTTPIIRNRKNSRPAGNLFSINGKIYRPAQNCLKCYGSGIEFMEVIDLLGSYKERHIFSLKPKSFKYNIGIHTINFYDDLCVIDGYGYLYPVIGRIMNFIWRCKKIKIVNGK